MLPPGYLDTAPEALCSLMRQLEDDILQDAAKRIGKMSSFSETSDWQLWRLKQLRGLRSDVIRRLAQYSGKTEAEIRALLQQAGTETLAADDIVHAAAGKPITPIDSSPALLNLLNAGYEQTLGTWYNLTATTAATVTGQFERALDRAWLQVSSGAFDYNTAIRRAVNDLSRNMAYITYPSGHRDTLEVAVRRAVLTGVNQTAGKLQVARMEEMGCGFVEVTAHSGARPEHADWQGKVYHRGGAVTYKGQRYADFETATGYGSGNGLCGWNCRHNFYPFYPGVSQRSYTQAELRKLDAREFEYQGKLYTKYELSQIQRGLERKVRKAKRDYLAEDSAGLDTSRSAVKLSSARQHLRQFCQETGLPYDSARVGKAGFGHSQASKAVWAAKKTAQARLASSENSGTIKTGRTTYTRKQLESMPLEQLRAETSKLAAQWYRSGRSGISFPEGTDYDAAASSLAASGTRASLIKDFRSLQAKMAQLAAEQAGSVTANAAGRAVTILSHTEMVGIPNSITQVSAKKGGISRNYYGPDGNQFLQISNDDHGNTSESGHGTNGEHAHDYSVSESGSTVRGASRELTEEERKENADIL